MLQGPRRIGEGRRRLPRKSKLGGGLGPVQAGKGGGWPHPGHTCLGLACTHAGASAGTSCTLLGLGTLGAPIGARAPARPKGQEAIIHCPLPSVWPAPTPLLPLPRPLCRLPQFCSVCRVVQGENSAWGLGSLGFVCLFVFNLMICKVMVLFLFLHFSAHI